MQFTGLDLLFLEVNNLPDSLDFYHEQLGFEVVSVTPAATPPIATLRAGPLRLMLVEQISMIVKRGRGVHFFFGVSDVDEFHTLLQARGLHVAPPQDEGWGGRFITLEDPDHYRLFFVTWTPER